MSETLPPPPPAIPPDPVIDPVDASLEWNCEEVFSRLLACDSRISGIERRHYSKEVASALDVFVIKAERGKKRLDGDEAYDLTMTILYATGDKPMDEVDKVSAATVGAIYRNPQSPDLDVTDIPMGPFYIEPDTVTKREDGVNTRKITITVPIIANLALS